LKNGGAEKPAKPSLSIPSPYLAQCIVYFSKIPLIILSTVIELNKDKMPGAEARLGTPCSLLCPVNKGFADLRG
jgi:hypothetical protein